jgi:hypothetical protein
MRLTDEHKRSVDIAFSNTSYHAYAHSVHGYSGNEEYGPVRDSEASSTDEG